MCIKLYYIAVWVLYYAYCHTHCTVLLWRSQADIYTPVAHIVPALCAFAFSSPPDVIRKDLVPSADRKYISVLGLYPSGTVAMVSREVRADSTTPSNLISQMSPLLRILMDPPVHLLPLTFVGSVDVIAFGCGIVLVAIFLSAWLFDQ